MPTPCFVVVDTDEVAVSLRRYVSIAVGGCPHGYHEAAVQIDRIPAEHDEDGMRVTPSAYADHPDDDPRWPAKCVHCTYHFAPDDTRQIFTDSIYRAADGREWNGLRDLPPGAMYDAWWMPDFWKGPDGRSLTVILPNGRPWSIDSRASNCTMPDDTVHKCWIRHGEPPDITVDKQGITCQAGAGSIQAGDYHGFLRDGVLTD